MLHRTIQRFALTLTLLLTTAVAAARGPLDDKALSRVPLEEAVKALTVYDAKLKYMNTLIERTPAVQREAAAKRDAFVKQFGAARNAVHAQATKADPDLDAALASALASNTKHLDGRTWTEQEARKDLAGPLWDPNQLPVGPRALLCAFNPDYRANPLKEVQDGFVARVTAPVHEGERQVVAMITPVSWVDVTDPSEKADAVALGAAFGEGPLMFKVSALRVDPADAMATGDALVELAERLSPAPSEGMTAKSYRQARAGRFAVRDLKGTLPTADGAPALALTGVQIAFVRDGVFVHVSALAIAEMDGTREDRLRRELSETLDRREAVIDHILDGMKIEHAK